MKLHEKIRLVRKKKKMSQVEVAKRANMKVASYNMKEKGNRTIRPEEFERIAAALNEPPEIFYSEKFNEMFKSEGLLDKEVV